MNSFSQLSSIALLIVLYGVSTSTASTSNASTSSNMNINHEKGFVSLKLNSRHGELERRRRERQRNLGEIDADVDFDATAENNQLEYNEERYRRREEAVQVGALFEVRWLTVHSNSIVLLSTKQILTIYVVTFIVFIGIWNPLHRFMVRITSPETDRDCGYREWSHGLPLQWMQRLRSTQLSH